MKLHSKAKFESRVKALNTIGNTTVGKIHLDKKTRAKKDRKAWKKEVW
jgi:hypothetical protein